MKRCLTVVCLFLPALGAAETPYKLPPREVVEIFDASPPPQIAVSPALDALLLVEAEAYPPIELPAQPILRIAGLRIAPALSAEQRTFRQRGLSVQGYQAGPARRVALPDGARIGFPVWSEDGKRFAFTRDLADGVELWVGEAATASARALPGLRLADVLGRPFVWLGGDKLLVRAIPAGRGASPQAARVPVGPVVQEVAGKRSQLPTFEDLLETPHDEDLFEYYARAQLAYVDAASGALTPVGEPGLFTVIEPSPDNRYLLVTRLRRPFSYRVPYSYFTRSIEVWDAKGARLAAVAELPISDEIPRQGVPPGPRSVTWQPGGPARLMWVEALDGGDPMRKVEHRDRLMALEPPFNEAPRELLRLAHRFSGLDFTTRANLALVSEFDRTRRWSTTRLVDLASPASARVVFDRSANDAYNDPGRPVYDARASGERLLLQDGDTVYLAGNGATETGDRPFLDRLDLKTLRTARLFRSDERSYERFVSFAGASRTQIVLRHESKSEPPNYFVLDLRSGKRRALTDYRDPAPQLQRVSKELVKYARADGVALSGTLYLPAGYKPGTRLAAFIWAYPLEYSDADTAGQVRSSPNAFTRLVGASPVFLVTQGYAVLMDATMPVVGDPETVNNTYVEQISADARAAIDKLDALGVADRKRVVVGGHSYGAFMTANLLAHTDLFVAGIARSGAYNRTLTPFGFQTERRSFWEVPDLYLKMSPFSFANKINEPVLLTHGEADNNSGTFPIQSQRLFDAIRGNGGTARLVLLPHEAHGYRARESLLHTLAEMIEWADRWTGNHPESAAAAVR